MTKDEALQMCLEYIETNAHERKYVRHAIKQALADHTEDNLEMVAPVAHIVGDIDHAGKVWTPAQPAPVQEPVYLVEDDFGLFRITNKGDYTYWSSTGRHKTFIANATPPEAQRKPLTHDEDNAICEANCNAEADAYFKARPQLDTTENRRIFYAGHRRAWLSYPCLAEAAHGIKE